MHKIKEFFNKKANSKHFIVVGVIFIFIFLITAFVYFRTEEIIYESISLTSILFLFLLGLIFTIKNYKEGLMYGTYIFTMILSVLSLQALLAKLMYKYTDIKTDVWLNSISVIVSALIGAGISGVISFILVSKQIKISKDTVEMQIKYSNEALEKQIDENKQLTTYTLEESKKETKKKSNNVALNYIYLLNAEMTMHRQIFIIYSYYKFHSKPVPKDLESIFNSLNSKKWDKLFVECAKCFSNKLMEDLSGYYYGIEQFKELELADTQKKNIIKDTLISMYNCISIAELEFNVKLRKHDVSLIEGKKVSINKTSGDLIIK